MRMPATDQQSELTPGTASEPPEAETLRGSIEAIVRAQFEAFRDRRREDSEALLAPDFTFTSPYDDAIDRDAFFARCWPPGDHFAELRVERIAADLEGAFITYLVTTDDGAQFRNTEYLVVSEGQIRSAHVYFGESYADGKFVAKQPG
jgi:ketosteroid isomerase-like protein